MENLFSATVVSIIEGFSASQVRRKCERKQHWVAVLSVMHVVYHAAPCAQSVPFRKDTVLHVTVSLFLGFK